MCEGEQKGPDLWCWWAHPALPQLGHGSSLPHLGAVTEQSLGEAPAVGVGSAPPKISVLSMLAEAALRPACMI